MELSSNNWRPRYLVLTVDYEIFGDGTGDVRQHVVEPTERMAGICSRYGVPLTVFFEVEEYLAFKTCAGALKRDLGYDPASLIGKQIISLGRQGHDVQLHLHPEWHAAKLENGRWKLGEGQRTVDELFKTQEEVTRYIRDRKSVIEEMMGAVAPGRGVRAYRAGAFSARPGRKLLAALAENGIVIDSSVVKGLRRSGRRDVLDYCDAPSAKGPWRVKEDVAREDPSGQVWEFPIYSVMRRRLHQATFSRLRAKFSRNVPKTRQKAMVNELGLKGANPVTFAKFLLQPVPIKLDFHNVSPAKLLKWIHSAPKPINGEPDVLVLIGHSKEHIGDDAFDRLLRGITSDSTLKVVTFTDVAEILESRDSKPKLVRESFQNPGPQLSSNA